MTTAGIVLAGGGARRLSGVDKPQLVVGGKALLRRAVDALAGVSPIVVVGPEREGYPEVVWTVEASRGAGPVAALEAGLACVPDAEFVVVLAGDLAAVTTSTVDRLRAAIGADDGAVLVDADGRLQRLIGVWRIAAVRSALPELTEGASLRAVFGGLRMVGVAAEPGESADIDAPEDLDGFAQ